MQVRRALVSAAIGMGLLGVMPAAGAEGTGTWTASVLPQPTPSQYVDQTPTAISCPAPGDCVVVGSYANDSTGPGAYIATISDGHVVSSVDPPLPADASGPSAQDRLNSVSCWAVGECVAVGSYGSTDNKTPGLIEASHHGVWQARRSPVLSGLYGSLDEVACNSAQCVVTARRLGPRVLSRVGNAGWAVQAVTAVSGDGPIVPTYPSCAPTGACYLTVNSDEFDQQAMFAYRSGAGWHAAYFPLPADGSAKALHVGRLSCPADGTCVAFGAYQLKGKYHFIPVVETFASGQLSVATLPVPEALTHIYDWGSTVVSCASVDRCVGYEEGVHTVLYQLENARWRYDVKAAQGFAVQQAACASDGACVVVDGASAPRERVLVASSGHWLRTVIGLPVSSPKSRNASLSDVSCAGTVCVADGIADNLKHLTNRTVLAVGTGLPTS